MTTQVLVSASALHDFKTLAQSLHPLITIETVEEERTEALVRAAAAELRVPIFEWSVTRGLRRFESGRPAPGSGRTGATDLATHGTTDPLGVLRHIETLSVTGVFLLKDFGPHLTSPPLVRAFRDVVRRFAATRSTIVITGQSITLPQALASVAVPVALSLPDEREITAMMATLLRSLRSRNQIKVSLGPDDERDIARALRGLTLNQARQTLAYAALDDGTLDASDIGTVLKRKAELVRESGLLEYFPVEDNTHELGGFAGLKGWLERARLGFSSEAQALNLKPPRGVLIVGVQGCGKSLAAKVIARSWRLPLLKLDAAGLYDKFIGESEKNLQRALRLAESMSPVVLWIDEIEKGFSTSGSDSDGGVSKRLLGSFLNWLQEHRAPVFVVAAANDVFGLPPELLRKGRFDEIFFVDLPDQRERESIFAIHLSFRRQDPAAFDLAALALTTDGFSGAEIEQAVVSGLYRALHGKTTLSTALLLEEISGTVPLSISRREDLDSLRSMARDRFVPVR